jgi:hypothetical protein
MSTFWCFMVGIFKDIVFEHFGSEPGRQAETASAMAAILTARYWQPLQRFP